MAPFRGVDRAAELGDIGRQLGGAKSGIGGADAGGGGDGFEASPVAGEGGHVVARGGGVGRAGEQGVGAGDGGLEADIHAAETGDESDIAERRAVAVVDHEFEAGGGRGGFDGQGELGEAAVARQFEAGDGAGGESFFDDLLVLHALGGEAQGALENAFPRIEDEFGDGAVLQAEIEGQSSGAGLLFGGDDRHRQFGERLRFARTAFDDDGRDRNGRGALVLQGEADGAAAEAAEFERELLGAGAHPENEGGVGHALPAALFVAHLGGGALDEVGRRSFETQALQRFHLGEGELDHGGVLGQSRLRGEALGGGAHGVAPHEGEGDLGAVGAEEAQVGEVGAGGVERLGREGDADRAGLVEGDGLAEFPGGGIQCVGGQRGAEGAEGKEEARRHDHDLAELRKNR